jgi:flagellin FlaB
MLYGCLKLIRNRYGELARAVAGLHSQRGMTGLETAIILIAFVTVAAVFGYAVLSAGLFSAEREKETIYAGLKQARANMELSGSVIVESANPTADNAQIDIIRFTIRNAIAGAPIDMTEADGNNHTGDDTSANRSIISLTTATGYFNNIAWTIQPVGVSDGDSLLESGEQFEITVTLSALGSDSDGAPWADPGIGPNSWFNIQVKPAMGSTMTIQRTLPAGLDRVMDLH